LLFLKAMKAVTYADEGYRHVSDLTLPLMRRHYSNQGIDLSVYVDKVDPSLDAYWNRIPIIQRELCGTDYLIWTDTDMIYYRRFDWQSYVEQAPPETNIWISGETKPHRPDVCCGFMIFRACAWTYDFLQTWRFLGPMRDEKIGIYCDWNRREQEAFNILWDWFASVYRHVKRIDELIVANPISTEDVQDKCVIWHFWGKSYLPKALDILSKM
jgi:hypothetical protein